MSSWGGPAQDTGEAAVLPVSTEAGELARQAGALTPVQLLQECSLLLS